MEDNNETRVLPSSAPAEKLFAERYRVLSTLGTGGMGKVVLAEDTQLDGDKVAIKILYANVAKNSRNVARFQNEVLLARTLSHRGIVRLHDFGDYEDEYYIIMEYIDGESLGERIEDTERPQLTFQEITNILIEIAEALDDAHVHNVIHRDLKPDNVLLTKDGEVKITDFGVARCLEQETGLTVTGEMVGTAYYMAPEQFRSSSVDGRADIYSMGILGYEMATGKRPFEKESYLALSAMHLMEDLPKVSAHRSDTPSWFQDFIETCSEKDPNNRFRTMADAADELLEHQANFEKGTEAKPSVLNKVLGAFRSK